jgi:hypothetical protein
VCNRHVRDVANRNSGSVVDATHESDGRSLTNSSATKKDHARYACGRQRLAFRNKLQGRVDLPINGNRSHPLTERVDSTRGDADRDPTYATSYSPQANAPTNHHVSSAEVGQHEQPSPPTTDHAAELYRTPTSSFGIAKEIAESFGARSVLETPTSALPGSSINLQSESVVVYQLFDFDLPPKTTLDALLETYLRAVHWFMLLFHEPSFRRRYEGLMAHGIQSRADSRFSLFMLTIWILGCQYTSEGDTAHLGFDVITFQKAALRHLEANLMFLFEDSALESVQVCVLLGSFYLYTGRPNLGFVVLGSGIRCAFALGLHREVSWPELPSESREERRRAWWSLFVFDRFASIVYGHPCGIRDGDFEVSQPRNLDDACSQELASLMSRSPEDEDQGVTAFTYMTCKIELYRLSSPIMTELYTKRASHQQASRIVHDIDKRLSEWHARLPGELQLDIAQVQREQPPLTPQQKTLALQALALQIAYDNILILLHRPLLHKTKPAEEPDQFRTPSPLPFAGREVPATTVPSACWTMLHSVNDISTQRCLESALRSASLCDLRHCLAVASNTHASAYFGINLFTAGMVLSTVALSRPLSLVAQQAKKAIRKILITSSAFKNDTPIARQTHRILSELVKLILDKELAVLTDVDPEALKSTDVHTGTTSMEALNQQPSSATFPHTGTGTTPRDSRWDGSSHNASDGGACGTPTDLNLLDGITSLQTGKSFTICKHH